MGKYIINGGNKLSGELSINGGKNAILPILAATVLNKGLNIIHNCPKISDTFIAIEILKSIGCDVIFEDRTIIVDSSEIDKTEVSESLVRKMRSSIIFLGGLLGRFKEVKISYPGGCELGARPIDLHLKSLKSLGTVIKEENGYIFCKTDNLKGTKIDLDFPSVGATENIMLASVLADDKTIIFNAAKEPEIIDLQIFLNRMGAKVVGAGTETIVIDGVKKLHSVEHTVMPDRIEAGTYLSAAAINKGEIYIKNVYPRHLYPITSKFTDMGCIIKEEINSIYLKAPSKLKSIPITRTLPHPGFPTDMQPQLMSVLTLSQGTSIIIETVFESRNKHIPELTKMGADIICHDGRTSVIKGVNSIHGSNVYSKDLRGGAALIIAGLAAEGETIVSNSSYVERGYENIEKCLLSLGADIKFVTD